MSKFDPILKLTFEFCYIFFVLLIGYVGSAFPLSSFLILGDYHAIDDFSRAICHFRPPFEKYSTKQLIIKESERLQTVVQFIVCEVYFCFDTKQTVATPFGMPRYFFLLPFNEARSLNHH